MGFFEFLMRVADNVAWIARTDSPFDIFIAIFNIFTLIIGILERCVWFIVYLFF